MAERLSTKKYHKSNGPKKNPLFSRETGSRAPKDFVRIILSDAAAILGTTLGVLFIFWYFTIYLSILHINTVHVEPTSYMPHDKVKQIVDSYLESKRVWVLPAKSFLFFSPQALEQRITDTFSKNYAIEDIDIHTTFPHTLTVKVTERVPELIWRTEGLAENAYYTVDRYGIVAQFKDQNETPPTNLPVVYDKNRQTLTIGSLAASQKYIEYILNTYEVFETTTTLPVVSFDFPKVECKELQYVMEEIFEDEIETAASDAFRNQKLSIQERFKNGELTIDQSLDELEKIKKEEVSVGGNTNSTTPKMRWQQVSVTVPCDYAEVSKELHVATRSQSDNQFYVYVDAQLDLATQLYNFNSAVDSKLIDPEQLNYFDARYSDRAYFKNK